MIKKRKQVTLTQYLAAVTPLNDVQYALEESMTFAPPLVLSYRRRKNHKKKDPNRIEVEINRWDEVLITQHRAWADGRRHVVLTGSEAKELAEYLTRNV